MTITTSNDYLHENSLLRVWQHFNSNRLVAILTAFRDKYDYNENVRRNKSHAADIKIAGYGYFYLDGAWIENKGTNKETHIKEDFIFVVGDKDPTKEKEKKFKGFIIDQGKKYEQDSVLIKATDGIKIYDQNGNVSLELSKLVPGKLGEIYTKMRRSENKPNRSFVFENERDGLGFFGGLVQHHKEKRAREAAEQEKPL